MPSPFQPTTDIPSSSSTTTNLPGPILLDGSEQDLALSNSDLLTRPELITRRLRRTRQLARIYRDNYWALIEEVRFKYREYYWEFGKSPFADDVGEPENDEANNNNNNINVNGSGSSSSNRCGVHGCKAKAMALTKFCHMHILSDAKQKLYKPCNFSIKSSTTGPILCGKPILKSTVPSYCPLHFQKAEKHMARALKKAGMNASSTSRSAPKFHVIAGEYVRRIKNYRKAAAHQANLELGVVKKNNS